MNFDIPTLVAIGGAIFLVYKFFFAKDVANTTSNAASVLSGAAGQVSEAGKDLIASLTEQVKSVVSEKAAGPAEEVTVVKIVKDWQTLRDDAEQAGLKDAAASLDEIWKMLNPNIGKNNAK